MFLQCFIKTMILVITYLAFGLTLFILVLYIRQIYIYFKLEEKPEYPRVIWMAKVVVIVSNLIVGTVCARIIAWTFPWILEIRSAIGDMVIAQPAYGAAFLALCSFPFLYLNKVAREYEQKE